MFRWVVSEEITLTTEVPLPPLYPKLASHPPKSLRTARFWHISIGQYVSHPTDFVSICFIEFWLSKINNGNVTIKCRLVFHPLYCQGLASLTCKQPNTDMSGNTKFSIHLSTEGSLSLPIMRLPYIHIPESTWTILSTRLEEMVINGEEMDCRFFKTKGTWFSQTTGVVKIAVREWTLEFYYY